MADNGRKAEIHISVRNLVEFILRSGDIDNRRAASPENAMQEGGRIHRMIQRRMGADYQAEVSLKYLYETEHYWLAVEGRADGIITRRDGNISVETLSAENIFMEQSSMRDTAMGQPPMRDTAIGQPLMNDTMEQPPMRDTAMGQPPMRDMAIGQPLMNDTMEQPPMSNMAMRQLPMNEVLMEKRPMDKIIVEKMPIPELSVKNILLKREATVSLPLVTIDEIKGTYRELQKLKNPVPVHLAQAKCYAYIYARQKGLNVIRVRMTYCNMETEEIKYFHSDYSFHELEEWFLGLIRQYLKWSDFEWEWKQLRQESVKALQFPYEYRKGQKDLVTYVYQTIYHKRKLFIEAPTGVGKTISTIFPAVKSMGEGRGERIFYLTAKTITRTVADGTFGLLREHGLNFKTVTLTAKDKICFMQETECNPEYCPYAKGHYDRINDAVYDLLTHSDNFGREAVESYAQAYRVCPFELCLDMSLFADGIICDYNYVFDPHVYLKRFFSDGVKGDYIFLVDEAHNLVDRGREMYSAVLRKEDFLKLKKTVKGLDGKMEHWLEKCNKELLALKRECENYRIEEYIAPFAAVLQRLGAVMEDYLEEHERTDVFHTKEIRDEVLDFYFEVSHFLDIYERVDENYVVYSEMEEDGSFILKLFCVNPSGNLIECMKKGRSTILFSATLLPIQYYKGLLGAEEGDYEVYAQSVFDPARKALFIGCDVTSRYTRRTEEEYYNIASYIYEIMKNRHGNYMVFFPSHMFLQKIYDVFTEHFFDGESMECIVQEDHMEEEERELFLQRFTRLADSRTVPEMQEDISAMEVQANISAVAMQGGIGALGASAGAEHGEPKSLLGFCVLGGIFSEGIDLKEDSLIGAVIVGTGLPQVCNEREILKNYFEEKGESGFDYAYRYPGMNKVLQAAGRVIRTAQDVGIVALLDERFLGRPYQRMFPREWETYEIVTAGRVAKRVERFWNEWL